VNACDDKKPYTLVAGSELRTKIDVTQIWYIKYDIPRWRINISCISLRRLTCFHDHGLVGCRSWCRHIILYINHFLIVFTAFALIIAASAFALITEPAIIDYSVDY